MRHSRTLGALGLWAASIGLLGCASLSAPRTSAEVASGLQREAKNIAAGRGFAGSQAFNAGALDERQSGTLRYALKAGERYIAIGLCDEQCKDIDLGVYDEDGVEIASDRQEDAIPIVEFGADEDALAVVRVKMIRCDLEPCEYGVGAYRE